MPNPAAFSPPYSRNTYTGRFAALDRSCKILCTRAIGLLLLAGLAPAGISMGNVAAQTPDPASAPGRRVFIQHVFPDESTRVLSGSTLNGISVDRVNSGISENPNAPDIETYALWQVSPANAARIITPMPVTPLTSGIDIEFLQTGTVTVTAYGYEFSEAPHESTEPGFNTAVFTFDVVSSLAVEEELEPAEPSEGADVSIDRNAPVSTPLSANARAASNTINLACASVSNAVPETGTSGQVALSATCETLALLDDPAASLDRLVPEEFFAIGDALTTTADNQINNIRSRINAVRSGHQGRFDISALNLQLWDQAIAGSVLNTAKDAAWHFGGGSASQDTVSDNAFGLFANGNISIGSVDGNGIQRDADISSSSLTLGADYRLSSHSVVGAALGFINDNTDFNGDNGDMDMQGISVSAFGTWYEHDKGYADIIFDVGTNNFDLTRRINLIGQNSENARSSTDATRVSISINAGRTFNLGATEFGPVGRITITRASIDAFSETSSLPNSGAGTTLNVNSHTQTSSRFSLGGEIKRVIGTSKVVLVPSGRIEVEHESETDKGVIEASFNNDITGNQMQVEGADRDSSAVLISIGSTFVFARAQSAFLFLETRTQDKHVSQNRVRIGYRAQF